MFNKGTCDHTGQLQAGNWYAIYKGKENVFVVFLFLLTSYYLNSSREKSQFSFVWRRVPPCGQSAQ